VRSKIQSAFEQLVMPHVAKVRPGMDPRTRAAFKIPNSIACGTDNVHRDGPWGIIEDVGGSHFQAHLRSVLEQ
jgi:hypothetical protein